MGRTVASLILIAACAWAPAIVAAPVNAQESADTFETLIEQGLSHREAGEDLQALRLFEHAFEISARPQALAQVALAEHALGRWVQAEAHLREALSIEGDVWVDGRREVLEHELGRIRARLGRLELLGEDGAEIVVDGAVVGMLPLSEPMWLAPGERRVELRHGTRRVSRSIPIAAGRLSRETIDLPPEERATTTQPDPPRDPDGQGTAPAEPEPESEPDPTLSLLAVTSLALAAAALGTGIILHAVRENAISTFNSDACLDFAPRTRELNCSDELSTARDAETGMTIAYAAAGALAVTGVVLLALSPSDAEPAPLACGLGPGDVGIGCASRF